MTTYIHHDSRDAKGHHRRTSWHIVRAPLAHARYYATYCRPEMVADDVMTEMPNAATCETCFRYEAKARERAERVTEIVERHLSPAFIPTFEANIIAEDDATTAPVDPT